MFIIGKYVKIRFNNRGSPCYFLNSRGQKIKIITQIEQKRLFLFQFLVSFFMAFLVQKRIYTTNIWFNFVFGSSIKLIYFRSLMQKDDLNKPVFQYKNWCSPKSDWNFFLTVRGPFHRKDFKWKKIWGYGVNFWKHGRFVRRT